MKMNKKVHAAVAAATVGLLLIAGTFAWTNFSAQIVNIFAGTGSGPGTGNPERTPGGTLHNDFEEGKDYRDVYVENWGSEPLIVRVRLSEYMEIGEGAGNTTNNQAVSIIDGASIDDVTTWTRFNGDLASTTGNFRDYWSWTMGGQKLYFPAPYDLRGRQDANGVEFVSTTSPVGVLDDDISLPGIYMITLDAEVISMAEWISRDMPEGNYWVVDTDGFSYWAAPLAPGDATGLLLHKVELVNTPEYDFFYAINVEAHMATVDDEPDNYQMLLTNASSEASILVNQVADSIRSQQNREHFEVVHNTNLMRGQMLEPIIFRSGYELRSFYNANPEWFLQGQSSEGENNYDEFLLNISDNYFNDRAIILVSAIGSSSTNFWISDVAMYDDEDVLEVHVNTHTPANSTADIINNLFVVSVERSLIHDNVLAIRTSSALGPAPE